MASSRSISSFLRDSFRRCVVVLLASSIMTCSFSISNFFASMASSDSRTLRVMASVSCWCCSASFSSFDVRSAMDSSFFSSDSCSSRIALRFCLFCDASISARASASLMRRPVSPNVSFSAARSPSSTPLSFRYRLWDVSLSRRHRSASLLSLALATTSSWISRSFESTRAWN